MSAETIRNRFLGGKKEFSENELKYFTEFDGLHHYAIGVQEDTPERKGVGIIRLVRNPRVFSEAEVAITLIDAYQHKGLGTYLFELILLAADERDITTISLTYLPQNLAIPRLARKFGQYKKQNSSQDFEHILLPIQRDVLGKITEKLKRETEISPF